MTIEVTGEERNDGSYRIASGQGSTVPGGGDGGGMMLVNKLCGKPGDIVFRLGDTDEVLRFNGDGAVFVRGEKVDDNREIYMAFRYWLTTTMVTHNEPHSVPPAPDTENHAPEMMLFD